MSILRESRRIGDEGDPDYEEYAVDCTECNFDFRWVAGTASDKVSRHRRDVPDVSE
ncbi:hypothetical protein KJ564_11720 [bacterium]|nr:hypothetical protein [bacterium]MBU1880897.1 hypothetical protein [bacterium]